MGYKLQCHTTSATSVENYSQSDSTLSSSRQSSSSISHNSSSSHSSSSSTQQSSPISDSSTTVSPGRLSLSSSSSSPKYVTNDSNKKQPIILIINQLSFQIFAPTNLVLTSDGSIDLHKAVHRDKNGKIISLQLPTHSIIMANHQVFKFSLYGSFKKFTRIGCISGEKNPTLSVFFAKLTFFLLLLLFRSLAYLADIHSALIIILKASLKWVPIVGPAMQMFSFIFLNRSWATDKKDLTIQLNQLADQTYNPTISSLNKIGLLIFPEGTLVSPLTRPASKKYAEKCGVDDVKHCLLPRSMGSLFCMRALSRKIPNLNLIDLTIGYPGIPSDGYGQDYYTLQSIFGSSRPPPKVHIHIKVIPVSDIPIGNIQPTPPSSSSSSAPGRLSSSSPTGAVGERKPMINEFTQLTDPSAEEIERFDEWLRGLWVEKDQLLDNFYLHGRFDKLSTQLQPQENKTHSPDSLTQKSPATRSQPNYIEFPIQLRSSFDLVRTFGLSLPGILLVLYVTKLVVSL
ncbi:hypothetical protein VP01_2068g2 [Puccinia sorghi]|uniref:Phospholipid/glycerol acyltransferase domain-containing protein n=1 Tax=Puccinia sorghi TaxID=27349 RepID=A0A0L6VAR4_9BASI|nr:hypothetical protein VP01_2068g2 [Puccinia sorghi]